MPAETAAASVFGYRFRVEVYGCHDRLPVLESGVSKEAGLRGSSIAAFLARDRTDCECDCDICFTPRRRTFT